jgi:hypothetical protein
MWARLGGLYSGFRWKKPRFPRAVPPAPLNHPHRITRSGCSRALHRADGLRRAMPHRRRELARIGRAASLLIIAGVAGSLLGACGGGSGSALTTRTGLTATQPGTAVPTAPTRTLSRPAETTEPTTPAEPTTTEPTTTAAEETTTATRPTVTVTVETQTTTASAPVVPETTTTSPQPTTTAVAAPPPSSSSSSSSPWPWIVLAVVLVAGVVIGLVVWRRRRAGAATWASRKADLTQRALVVLDDVLAQGSVVTGQVEALAAEARSLEQRAPDDAARAEAGRIRARLDELAGVLESDRSLHLASPPPSPEQLSYSAALIRQKVQELQGVLRPPPPDPGAAST